MWRDVRSAASPEAAYAALQADDRDLVDAFILPASLDESVTVTQGDGSETYSSVAAAQRAVASLSGCWGTNVRVTAHAALGNALWDTYTEGTWCGSGSKVTSASFGRSWSTIAAIGWRDGGQIGRGAGVVSNQGRIWSQRKMILGSGGWDVQTMQPCVRLNGSSAGKASVSQKCSIY